MILWMKTKTDKIAVLELIQAEGIGGAEMVLYNTVTHLDRDRFEVRVLVVGFGLLIDRLRTGGYEVDQFEFRNSYNLSLIQMIRKIIKDHKIDIVHSHLSRMNMYGYIASMLTPAVNVMTIHGESEFSGWLARIYYSLFGNLSGRVVAVSELLAESFHRRTLVRKSNVEVVHNGIDTGRFNNDFDRDDILKRFDFPSDTILILAVGNIRPIKGYGLLIDAFELIAAKEQNARLLICGGEIYDHRKNLQDRIAEHEHSDRIRLSPFVEDIEAIYSAADFYVLPSVSEGFSLTTVEAMASGLPVVTTDCLGPREIIDNNLDGIIIPNRDPALLASAIIDLLNDPDKCIELGQAARKKVADKFTIKEAVGKFERLFETLAGDRRS